jgi:uncharacterized protein YlxW (UPF0749 family)
MNPFEMVVLIVAIVMIAGIFKSRRGRGANESEQAGSLEAQQLREEVQRLKERVQTLERITVEKENSLAREIEDLRTRP